MNIRPLRPALFLLAALAALAAPACRRHSVEQGGACAQIEDCRTGAPALMCSATPAQPQGICTQPCTVWPAAANVTHRNPDGTTDDGCPAGWTCRAATPAHPQLGAAYCQRPN